MTLGKINPISVDYALTVTLNPKVFRSVPPMQYRETYSALEMILHDNGYKYVIIPELTPKNQNVHYHIILKTYILPEYKKKGLMYHIRNLFRNTKLFGYIDLKQCDDTQGWIKYMLKELPETIKILDLCPEYGDIKKEKIEEYLKQC